MLSYLSTLLGLSPEMLNLVMMGLTLAVSIAHMRGNDLPILSALLKLLGGKPVGPAPVPPVDPPAPTPLDDHPVIKRILDELAGLRKLLK